ncbi:MAG: DUF4838 domain-containing protein [Planctomycetaceae bacterium]|nr:MAG: DUF4838 domain-containing protein [Planctomycetaceae bacterium]
MKSMYATRACSGVLLMLWIAVAGAAGDDTTLVLVDQGKSDYVICLPTEPTPVQRTAAAELQEHLAMVTGVTLPIRSENDIDDQQKSIIVGDAARLKQIAPDLNLQQLGYDGIVIRTCGPHLVLAGHATRGALYAVYTFLEDVVGCRWWTSTESYIPKRTTLRIEPLDQVHEPRLQSRAAFYRDAFDPVFAARRKLNGHHHRISAEYGGHRPFCGFVHTFYPLLPPEKYFDRHPEWYSEIDGRRTHHHAQLCLTNDAMRRELTANALARLRNQPDAQFLSISQNDWYGRCECENCLRVEQSEDSPAGPLLRFVNAVAEDVEKEFPDVLVETLAYQYTRQPPKLARPRDNVVIRLCSIECSFVQPLADGAQNEAFRNDILGWSKIADRLFVWDYVTNFSSYILPHPNLRVLGPNIRFFVDHHVIGLFEQGDAHSSVGDFVRLRAWLISQLMWNPDLDERLLIREFMQGYYGPAAPHLIEYLEIIHDAAERSGVYLRCFMEDTSAWLSLEDLNAAMACFDRAAAAVADNPEFAKRVRRERLPLDHVWLNRYHALQRTARIRRLPFAGPEDPMAACEEFIRLANEFDVRQHREHGRFQDYEANLRSRFRPPGPPPERCRDLNADQWFDVPAHQIHLARPGEWTCVVQDPLAADGHAVRMPGDHRQWAAQVRFSDDLRVGNPWRCYVVARYEGSVDDGVAMTMGIYDSRDGRSVAHHQVDVDSAIAGQYQVFDLGTHDLRGQMYLWVAPPERPGRIDSVLIDRIFFVRQTEP